MLLILVHLTFSEFTGMKHISKKVGHTERGEKKGFASQDNLGWSASHDSIKLLF